VNILLLSLTAAFGAFCVWLTIRFVNRRERWAKWTLAVTVGLPVLYVASFGPACWISSRAEMGQTVVTWIYNPLGRLCDSQFNSIPGPSPNVWSRSLNWYATVFAADDWSWLHIGGKRRRELVFEIKWAPNKWSTW
jgi:hypothetical protein